MSSILVLDPAGSLPPSRLKALSALGHRIHALQAPADTVAVLKQESVAIIALFVPEDGFDAAAVLKGFEAVAGPSEPSVIVVAPHARQRELASLGDLFLPDRVSDAVLVRAVRLVLQGRASAPALTSGRSRQATVTQPSAVPPTAGAATVTRAPEIPAGSVRTADSHAAGEAVASGAASGQSGTTGGTYVNGYRVIRALGRGGMSMVYLAHHEASGEDRVLKILPISEHDGGLLVQRLINEAALLSQISHPSVVRVYEHGFTDWHAYIAIEYLAGGDLRTLLGKPFPPALAIEATIQLAGALEAVHAAGMIHRDLKPENVLRRADGTFVLADFGIARQTGVQLSYVGTGHVMGTAAYLAPELMGSSGADHRSDLYSLGVLLFEMLTGRKPYDSDDAIQVLNQHLKAPVPRLPAPLAWAQGLIDRTMAKRPEARFASASELVSAVLTVVSTLQASSNRTTPDVR